MGRPLPRRNEPARERSAGAEPHAAGRGGRGAERPTQALHRRSGFTRPCSYDPPKATPEIVAERQHPGIDDLQSSSFAGLTVGGVECNSTVPGEGDIACGGPVAAIPWYVPYFPTVEG
jgi:hypothetical protein